MTTQRFNERLQQRRCVTDPLRKQRAIQLDAFACIHDRLPVKRHMVCKLRDEYVCQQPWAGETAFDWTTRRRRLGDVVAAHASKLRAHMTDDPEACRHILKFRQYAWLVHRWIVSIGLDDTAYGRGGRANSDSRISETLGWM